MDIISTTSNDKNTYKNLSEKKIRKNIKTFYTTHLGNNIIHLYCQIVRLLYNILIGKLFHFMSQNINNVKLKKCLIFF